MPGNLDIPLQRNEDWSRTLYLTADEQPIDVTGMAVAMQVRDNLTQALVASAQCEIIDGPGGAITAKLLASGTAPLATYGNPIQAVSLPYDLRLTESDGFQTVLLAGQVILSRGETV